MTKKIFDLEPYIDHLKKISKPVPRKRAPKPGSLLKGTDLIVPGVEFLNQDGEWERISDNALVMGWTKAYVDEIEPTKYRYPLK